MWTYRQRSGELLHGGEVVGRGYAGNGQGKNNPAKQDVKGVGPLPRGRWQIIGPPYDTATHGPYVLRLSATKGTLLYGRTGFLIHGDSVAHPGTASQGCIILARALRERIWTSRDFDLEVTA